LRPLYFAGKAIAGMRNASLVNILAAMTIAVTLTLFGISLVGLINANRLADRLGSRLEVAAYLKEGISKESLERLEEEIRSFPEVMGLSYISKEDALASLKKELSGDSYILEGLDGNPLPASFVIRLKPGFRNHAGVKGVTGRLMGNDSIEDLQYGGEWIERLSALMSAIKIGSMALGIGLILSTMLIVSATIRLTIQTRMDEIEVMRLVGATPLFIKAPFYIEGAILGAFGALFAALAMAALRGFMEYNFGNGLRLLFGGSTDLLPYQAVVAVFSFGVISGTIGSIISLWRFPKA
jgi:cell division transport system permease protein